MIFYTGEIQL